MKFEYDKITAEDAKNLLTNETFKKVLKNVRNKQLEIFYNSSPDQVESREDSHAIVQALRMITDALYSSIDEENILQYKQKGQHRNG